MQWHHQDDCLALFMGNGLLWPSMQADAAVVMCSQWGQQAQDSTQQENLPAGSSQLPGGCAGAEGG